MTRTTLRPKGGLFRVEAELEVARTRVEVRAAFERAKTAGRRIVLVGARRSFGEQFLPGEGDVALDVSELERGAIALESNDAGVWVRAGGGTRFRDLRSLFPEHRTDHPPTTDTITLAGALAACTHDSFGYFADSVRAFTLLTPTGEDVRCERDGSGRSRELFFGAIGAFGALGVVTDVELFLVRVAPGQQVAVHAVYAGPAKEGRYLDEFERAVDSGRFAAGVGLGVYGVEGATVVLGDEWLAPGEVHAGKPALLTDDDVDAHVTTQALANRFLSVAEWAVTRTYREGARLISPWYGFQFFQRGYDRAPEVLGGTSLRARLFRALGVAPELPVCHQSWFFPRRLLRQFFRVYWDLLAEYPDVAKRSEQQDAVLLGPCSYPLHSIGSTSEPVAIFTASQSVRTGGQARARSEEFLRRFTDEVFARLPEVRVSLCKQMHVNDATLRAMHDGYAVRLRTLRSDVDPTGLLDSRFLARLGVTQAR